MRFPTEYQRKLVAQKRQEKWEMLWWIPIIAFFAMLITM